jgi:dTMP kinase
VTARGRFITFEGGEGAGKSTQVRMLASRLKAAGRQLIATREPGGSPGAEAIRKLLVEGAADRWAPLPETLLFLAARSDHVASAIEPALAAGHWVICDRFSDSTVVYQGIGRGLGVERVRALQQLTVTITPDLTFVLDTDPREGLARTHGRAAGEDRFEQFDAGFHFRLREAFLGIARSEPKRCTVVDSSQPPDIVAEEIWRTVEARLG